MHTTSLVCLVLGAVAACAPPSSGSRSASDGAAATPASCPATVVQTITQKFPDASITACKLEHEDGRDQFEVKVADKAGAPTEADVSPDGTLLQVEQIVTLDKVPAPVTAALTARYPGVSPARVEQQTHPGHPTTYEFKLPPGSKAKEATFGEDGSFVGEE